jgi:hypothetical protein
MASLDQGLGALSQTLGVGDSGGRTISSGALGPDGKPLANAVGDAAQNGGKAGDRLHLKTVKLASTTEFLGMSLPADAGRWFLALMGAFAVLAAGSYMNGRGRKPAKRHPRA